MQISQWYDRQSKADWRHVYSQFTNIITITSHSFVHFTFFSCLFAYMSSWCQVALCAEIWWTLNSVHISFSVVCESSLFRHSYASEVSPCSMHLCEIAPYSDVPTTFCKSHIKSMFFSFFLCKLKSSQVDSTGFAGKKTVHKRVFWRSGLCKPRKTFWDMSERFHRQGFCQLQSDIEKCQHLQRQRSCLLLHCLLPLRTVSLHGFWSTLPVGVASYL